MGATGDNDIIRARAMRLYIDRLVQMARCEWLLREQSNLFGFMWTLLQPLLLFIVFYGLFTKWMGPKTPNYGAFLVIGIVHYNFFQNTTSYVLTSLRRRTALLTNFPMPRDLFVFAAGLSGLVSHLFEMLVMFAFLIFLGTPFHSTWFLIPLILLLEAVLVLGVFSPLLAVWGARFSDFDRIWGLLTTMGMFLTPVFYPLEIIEPSKRELIRLNPVAAIIGMSRRVIIDGQGLGVIHYLAILALFAALSAASYAYFKRHEPHLADYVLT